MKCLSSHCATGLYSCSLYHAVSTEHSTNRQTNHLSRRTEIGIFSAILSKIFIKRDARKQGGVLNTNCSN